MGGPGGPRNGQQDYGNSGGWGGHDSRGQDQQIEVTFVVPSNKCGVIIGKGTKHEICKFLSILFNCCYRW